MNEKRRMDEPHERTRELMVAEKVGYLITINDYPDELVL
jgi:hypothetical protein